jgi:hypothetical protein
MSATPAPAAADKVGHAVASAAKPPEPAEPAEASGGEKPTRPPHEILQLKDTLFKLNFEESERGRGAAESCDRQAAGQPKKRSACMAQARDAVDVADGYQVQHVGDDWVWKAVRQRGNRLVAISKTPFEFGRETDNSITLNLQGKKTSELKIGVPSDYRIVITDARYGQLVYEAKVGIATGGD